MTKQHIALITDSACDLPPERIAAHDIQVVPLYLIWGDQELRDRVDIQPGEFYTRLETDPIHPKTSQPTPQDFVKAIEQAQAAGAEEAVIITISSGMSSTFNSAQQAVAMVDFPVQLVDSRANSMSQGWQVLAAAAVRDQGGDAQAMCAAAHQVRDHSATLLMVDTLEYMHRGGRINGAVWLIGSALNLKPQLYVDHQTGTIEPGARTRTRSKSVEAMYKTFFDWLDTTKSLRVAVLHGNVLAEAQALAERIQREYNPVDLIISMTSPVMGVHTGPGALALCGYAAG
jgi:DegV family protein with EDD domain